MYKFKLPKRKKPLWSAFKTLVKPFYKVDEIINLAGDIPDKFIAVSNHSAKSGPVALDMYFPKPTAKWGAHEMLEGYGERFKYLRDVFYIKKQGMGKFGATLKSAFEAFFSPFPYGGMNFIPSYPDARLKRTLDYSMQLLDANIGVLVFPEDSNEGYKEEPTSFFGGFVMLAEIYFKKTGEDVPIIPTYYHKKKKKIIIGEPQYVQKIKSAGIKTRDQIAEYFRNLVNGLFQKYVKNA